MSKDDGNQADEQPVVETPEIQVELDREPDVQGELVENSKLEEEAASEDEQPAAEDASDADNKPESGEAGGDEPASDSDTPEVNEEDTKPTPELKIEESPAPPQTKDPGEFASKGDYSFEVTTTDGKTIKINSQAEADAFAERLDSEEGLVSASQFAKFARAAARMDTAIEGEQKEFLQQKEKFEAEQAQEQSRNQTLQQWNNEINYLQAKGLLPEIDATKNADWLGNADDPAVKARMDVFSWMDKENAAREAAGIPKETSVVSAYHQMMAEQADTTAKQEAANEKQTRQRKGSMVGGNAPFSPDNQPKGAIVGTGGTLRDYELEAIDGL